MTDVIITIEDLRKARRCVIGARRWFKAHRLDFNAFLEHGLPAQTLIDAGDEFGANIVRDIVASKEN